MHGAEYALNSMNATGKRYRQVTCLTQAGLLKRELRIPDDSRLDVPAGTTKTLCDIAGPGRIVRLWMTLPVTGRGPILRSAILRMFWDNEPTPSVECPLGDFFGASFARPRSFVAERLMIIGGAYLCYFEMPFRERAVIEVENQSRKSLRLLFFQVGYYEEDAPKEPLETLHAQWRRQNPTEPAKPFLALSAEGKGRLVGVKMDLQNRSWWLKPPLMKMFFPRGLGFGILEGPETIEIDRDESGTIVGTGTEDFFDGGWYFKGGTFYTPTHGVTLRSLLTGRVLAYRFFANDPIPFERSISLSFDHGVANDMKTDHACVTYWYQQEPHAAFPKLPKPEGRIPTSALSNVLQILIGVSISIGFVVAAILLLWFLVAN